MTDKKLTPRERFEALTAEEQCELLWLWGEWNESWLGPKPDYSKVPSCLHCGVSRDECACARRDEE